MVLPGGVFCSHQFFFSSFRHRRFPLAGEPLSLGDLFRCHPRRNGVSSLCSGFAHIPGRLRASKVEPHVSSHVILRDTHSMGIHEPEAALRGRMSLLDGEPEPPNGLGIILRAAVAVLIHDPAEEVLRGCVPLVGGEPEYLL